MITPIVRPVHVQEYEFKQSKYDVAPRLPFAQIITGPSGSGKGVLLQSMILDIYRNVFERIYVWSPSVSVDSNWTPVRRYIQDELKVDLEKEKCFFDEYIPEELEKVIKQQHKVIEYQKKNDHSPALNSTQNGTGKSWQGVPPLSFFSFGKSPQGDLPPRPLPRQASQDPRVDQHPLQQKGI